MIPPPPRVNLCLKTLILAAGTAMIAGTAAAALLPSQIVLRPLTPGDKGLYGLPSTTQVSGGLCNVGVGQPMYLEAEVDLTIPASNIVSVAWSLTNTPIGSVAALVASPLGTNVPVYEPSDRLVYQVAARKLLRPDVAGQYTVLAAITTSTGVTNVAKTITVGTYMGVNTCALCHSGGLLADDKVHPWQQTAHSGIFTAGINGLLGHYAVSCLPCHTVGYDTTAGAVNGGFDDVATKVGWTFPAVLTNGNWESMPAALQSVANISCENCHGPGSQHAYSLGDTNLIAVTLSSGDCNQCHDAPTHHIKGTEWYNSAHAVTTRDPAGSAGCVICHTANGFLARISNASTTNTAYAAIGCQTCHEPHGQTIPTNNPALLRTLASITLMDGFTTITNGGRGMLCMNCHMSRRNATNYVETAAPSSHFGPHEGPQADMIMGVNAITYGKPIGSSAHSVAIEDLCVTCHMQATATTDPAFLLAGGHTWKMSCTKSGTNYQMVAACAECHGAIKTFDIPRQDYDGNGLVEGVQTEVQHLMDRLALLLPPVGQAKTDLAIDNTWTRQQLRAGYNYLFVQKDGSRGVHNAAYAVGLLKASIADLTGDANNDGIPDAWQIQYFGSITSPNAAPNASPAGDGIPNWLKYSLGLDPWKAGLTLPDGVLWANGSPSGGTNMVRIYTAAEVNFDTVSGTTYQLQSISSLGGGWQNIGNSITATNNGSMSFLTPTRNNNMQFYRVAHSP